MNKLIKLFVFLDIALILLPIICSFGIRLIPANYQPSLYYPQKIFKTETLTQTFMAKKDNLGAIGVSIKNPQLVNKKDISLILKEGDSFSRISTLNGNSIKDGEFVKFMFIPLKESKDKQYSFQVSSPNSERDDALEVFVTNQGINGQQMFFGSEFRLGAISFVDFYKPVNFYEAPLLIYEDLLNRFSADFPFTIFYLTLITILAGTVIRLTLKKN